VAKLQCFLFNQEITIRRRRRRMIIVYNNHQSSIINHQSSIINHQSPIINHQSSSTSSSIIINNISSFIYL